MVEGNDRPILLKSRMGDEFADAVYGELQRKYNGLFEVGETGIDFFPNREPDVRLKTNVARRRVYVVHVFEGSGEVGSPHDNYHPQTGSFVLYHINDALKRASAGSITNVLPHTPYQRGDRKEEGRVPIAGKLFLDLLGHSAGRNFERVITIEMHSGQQQGFVEYPIDNLYANREFARYLRAQVADCVVVAPDAGGGKRARDLARRLNAPFAYADKVKRGSEKERIIITGEVDRPNAIIPDDMVDTGSTLCLAADALRKKGVRNVYACATHALLSPKGGKLAEERLQEADIRLVVGDTIPMSEPYRRENSGWLTVISFAPLFADAIYERETKGSISRLFENHD